MGHVDQRRELASFHFPPILFDQLGSIMQNGLAVAWNKICKGICSESDCRGELSFDCLKNRELWPEWFSLFTFHFDRDSRKSFSANKDYIGMFNELFDDEISFLCFCRCYSHSIMFVVAATVSWRLDFWYFSSSVVDINEASGDSGKGNEDSSSLFSCLCSSVCDSKPLSMNLEAGRNSRVEVSTRLANASTYVENCVRCSTLRSNISSSAPFCAFFVTNWFTMWSGAVFKPYLAESNARQSSTESDSSATSVINACTLLA